MECFQDSNIYLPEEITDNRKLFYYKNFFKSPGIMLSLCEVSKCSLLQFMFFKYLKLMYNILILKNKNKNKIL